MNQSWRAAIPALTLALILAVLTAVHFAKARALAHRQAAEALACLAKAERGDADAEVLLGSRYFHGVGVPQDYTEAAYWYRRSANQGDAAGEYFLGYQYHYGQGVPHDDAEAMRWCRLAAAQGDRRAEAAIGSQYHKGEGVPRDDAEALRWLHRAADQGDPWAEDFIGMMYYEGDGVLKDNVEAARWFRKAADQGDPTGEYDLSTMYAAGLGVPRSRAEEMSLLRQAAVHGDLGAQQRVTLPLTPWRKFTLIAVAYLCFWIITEFFDRRPRFAHDPIRRKKELAVALAAAVSLCGVPFLWYGYTHHLILRLGVGINTFTACRWILDALVIAIAVYILRAGKHPAPNSLTSNL